MKKIFFLTTLIMTILMIISCKEIEIPVPECPEDNDKSPVTYYWPGYAIPKPVEFQGKTQVSSGVYDYAFRMHLNGSQVDPNPLTLISFSIPHVGPNGDVIYRNVPNDAQYTITSIEGEWVYYTIRSAPGHILRYNISKMTGPIPGNWFLKHGLPYDDGINNIITFATN